jgi:hypothetical protein
MTYLLLYPCRLLRLYPSSLTSARLQAVPKLQVYFVLASRRMVKLGPEGQELFHGAVGQQALGADPLGLTHSRGALS